MPLTGWSPPAVLRNFKCRALFLKKPSEKQKFLHTCLNRPYRGGTTSRLRVTFVVLA
jgi:hypothetical protein